MDKEIKVAIQLNREQLKSITIEDVLKLESEKLTDDELSSRSDSAHSFYRIHFKKLIKYMIFLEALKMAKEAETKGQILFGRGTLNGLYLVQQWFDAQESISLSKTQKDKGIEDVLAE